MIPQDHRKLLSTEHLEASEDAAQERHIFKIQECRKYAKQYVNITLLALALILVKRIILECRDMEGVNRIIHMTAVVTVFIIIM